MWSPLLEDLLGPPREPGTEIQPRHQEIAGIAQIGLEEALLRLGRRAKSLAPSRTKLCLSGGVALNCVANGRITREGGWDEVFIPPSPHDSGTALGAAFLARQRSSPGPRPPRMRCASLGSGITPLVAAPEGPWRSSQPGERLPEVVSRLLAAGKIVAWAVGRGEFGPRALGNRSILADPRKPENKEKLNLIIKKRESFRPFAPVVPEELAAEIFDLGGFGSPFMLRTVPVHPAWRDRIPAAVHVDGTARVQTLSRGANPLFYWVLVCFQKETGVPVLLNTSLNTSEEPIANGAEDALKIFRNTEIDALVLDRWLLEKTV
jgi:carbamoyltransferase